MRAGVNLRIVQKAMLYLASIGFVVATAMAQQPLPQPASAPLTEPIIYPAQRPPPATPKLPTGTSGTGVAPAMRTAGFMSPSGLPTEAGRTVGHFTVTNDGAATYTIPLWTAPGIGQLKPNLALVYNSHQGDGLYGVGWSLSGLSAISRCNKTYAQDGFPAAVTLTSADRFCLDGMQLKLTSGTYGAANSTYGTEIESFSKVAASSTTVGNGPASFTVTTKNGLIYEYGTYPTTSHSQVILGGTVMTWALSRIRDRTGNYINFDYTQANGTYVLTEIDYPFTVTGQGPFYKVLFT